MTEIHSSNNDESGSSKYQPPVFMMSAAEASNIESIVLPLQNPIGESEEALPSLASHETVRGSLESVLNEAFLIPNLLPGRTFSLTILEHHLADAYADGFENIVIYSGSFSMEPLAALTMLCHETAHSARNHDADPQAADVPDAAYNVADKYLNEQFDAAGQIYVHNREGYLATWHKWQAATDRFANLRKRQESEADLFGALICAQFGLRADSFIRGEKMGHDFFTQQMKPQTGFAGFTNPADIADGMRFSVDFDDEDFFDFLFPMETHPRAETRLRHLQYLADVIDAWHIENPYAQALLDTFTTKGNLGPGR